jgi:hypothetical protein
MPDLERDLRIVSAITADLKAYLLSDSVYWPLSDTGPVLLPYPLGTLGGLLLRLRKLETARGQLTTEQSERLQDVASTAHATLDEWIVQKEQKAAREIKARLQTWGAFLDDLIGDAKRFQSEYASQVEGRTILPLLFAAAGKAADGQGLMTRLASLDERLKTVSAPGDFVWDTVFAPGFSRQEYPWLYVQPRR